MTLCSALEVVRTTRPAQSVRWDVEVDHVSSGEWSGMLDLFLDASFYQTAAYGEARWGARGLSRLVLRRNGEVVGIAQLRIIRPTALRYGMAWLRWGPLWEKRDREWDPAVPIHLARAIEEEYVLRRKLLVRILPGAFGGSRRAEVFQDAFANFRPEADARDLYRTFVLDLTPPLEVLRKQLDGKWRNQLNRAEKNNLTVVSGDGISEFRKFCEVYTQMRERKNFDTTVDISEFAHMQEILPPGQRMRILLCLVNGVPAAGLVASVMGDSAMYLLGATGDAGLSVKGAYLLHWTLITWLKERGVRNYDLGGIDPMRNPGVFHFKKGFSGRDVTQIAPVSASGSRISSGMAATGIAVQQALRAISNLKASQ